MLSSQWLSIQRSRSASGRWCTEKAASAFPGTARMSLAHSMQWSVYHIEYDCFTAECAYTGVWH